MLLRPNSSSESGLGSGTFGVPILIRTKCYDIICKVNRCQKKNLEIKFFELCFL